MQDKKSICNICFQLPSSHCHFSCAQGCGVRWKLSQLFSTLDKSPVYLRDTWKDKQLYSHLTHAGTRRTCKPHTESPWDHQLESVNQCSWREKQRIGHTPTKWFYCEFTTKPSLMWTEQRLVSGCSCGDAALIVLVRECVATKTSVHNHEGPGLALSICAVCACMYTQFTKEVVGHYKHHYDPSVPGASSSLQMLHRLKVALIITV